MKKKLRKDKRFTLSFPLEIRSISDDGIVEGYVSVFDVVDSYGTAIQKGAFKQTLSDNGVSGVKVLYQHDSCEPIGVPLEMREDEVGLFTRTQLILSVQRAAEVYELLKAGALDAFSIGFVVTADEYDPLTGVIKILSVELWEYSIVTFPSNRLAMVTNVRSNEQGLEVVEEAEDTQPETDEGEAEALEELRSLNATLEFRNLFSDIRKKEIN